jgi:hypothetical protein
MINLWLETELGEFLMRTLILKNSHAWQITLAIIMLLFGTSIVAFATSPTVPLTWQNLKEDALLGKQITLDAKHLPLGTLLTLASEQSGVNISLPPNSPLSQKLVTARISAMNLYDFMDAIGRTYNASWSKINDGAFILIPKNDTAIEKGISELGTEVFYRYRDRVFPPDAEKMLGDNDIKIRNDLYQKVLLAADPKALASDKGVPLSSLPPTLVDSLEYQFKKANAVHLLLEYPAYKKISEDDIVRIIVKQDPALEDPHAWLNGHIPDPLYDKVITIELLTPDLKQVNGTSIWQLLGKWIPPKPVE